MASKESESHSSYPHKHNMLLMLREPHQLKMLNADIQIVPKILRDTKNSDSLLIIIRIFEFKFCLIMIYWD